MYCVYYEVQSPLYSYILYVTSVYFACFLYCYLLNLSAQTSHKIRIRHNFVNRTAIVTYSLKHLSLEVFRNEILTTWQKNLYVEVILISELMNSEIRITSTKKWWSGPYFWIHESLLHSDFSPGCQDLISKNL